MQLSLRNRFTRLAAMSAMLMAMPAAALANAAAAVPTVDKGDTAWMMTSSLLVLMMILPGLALFYGGLARTKNMLSVMTQVGAVAALTMLVWVGWGYTEAFGPDREGFLGNIISGFGKAFLHDVSPTTTAATFSAGVAIPEYVFVCFQMTFAAITIALVLGAVVERMKFSAVMVFAIIWLTIVYFPIAHMVWASTGAFFKMGALDYAGGTVVHINSGVSALVACLILGKRIGYPREPMAPHSLTMTGIGTGLLWVGWFGFNAGSALEAGNSAALAFLNTYLATSCAVLSWSLGEALFKGKPTMLGAASGAVAGLVAITPAAGNVGIPGAFVIGLAAGIVCLWGVSGLKKLLGADDSLDVFGVHAVGGILGALLTGVFNSPDLGGPGFVTDWVTAKTGFSSIGEQLWVQAKAVGLTIVWSGVVAFIAFKLVDLTIGLRVPEEDEREGLDTAAHGEAAYRM